MVFGWVGHKVELSSTQHWYNTLIRMRLIHGLITYIQAQAQAHTNNTFIYWNLISDWSALYRYHAIDWICVINKNRLFSKHFYLLAILWSVTSHGIPSEWIYRYISNKNICMLFRILSCNQSPSSWINE